jgi:hypothetical protein
VGTYERALAGDVRLYAVWPGKCSTHLFAIDDLEQYAGAFGIVHDATRTGLADHEHQARWSVSPYEEKPNGVYISIDVFHEGTPQEPAALTTSIWPRSSSLGRRQLASPHQRTSASWPKARRPRSNRGSPTTSVRHPMRAGGCVMGTSRHEHRRRVRVERGIYLQPNGNNASVTRRRAFNARLGSKSSAAQ